MMQCDCGCGKPARLRVVVRDDNRLSEEPCERCGKTLSLCDGFTVHIFDRDCRNDSDEDGWHLCEWWGDFDVMLAILRICQHCGRDNQVFNLDTDVTDIRE